MEHCVRVYQAGYEFIVPNINIKFPVDERAALRDQGGDRALWHCLDHGDEWGAQWPYVDL